MNSIHKDELFAQVTQFLKTKGIDLQEGAYTSTIQKGCGVLADTINLSQQALERARAQVERELDNVRRVIHEKTAPKSRSSPPPETTEPASDAQAPKTKGRRSATHPRKRGANPKSKSRKKGTSPS